MSFIFITPCIFNGKVSKTTSCVSVISFVRLWKSRCIIYKCSVNDFLKLKPKCKWKQWQLVRQGFSEIKQVFKRTPEKVPNYRHEFKGIFSRVWRNNHVHNQIPLPWLGFPLNLKPVLFNFFINFQSN